LNALPEQIRTKVPVTTVARNKDNYTALNFTGNLQGCIQGATTAHTGHNAFLFGQPPG
jgi:hypothetical protein